jgi:hypothetical protein
MNTVRERILIDIAPYMEFSEHKDLIAFCVCSEYFMDCEDEENGIEADFNELVAVVEKDWLFEYMDMEDPLDYLQNEYTSDDSIDWYDEALKHNKVVMVSFN